MLEKASTKADRFGWAQMDGPLKDDLCKDWCDTLAEYKLQEVQDGIKAVFSAANGKVRAINEYQVKEQILIAHSRAIRSLPATSSVGDKNKPLATEEERKAILKKAGFSVRRFGK